jgi:hypothetical protein
MNRFVKIGLLMVLAVALFGTYRFVSAQEKESGPPTGVAPGQVSAPAGESYVLATKHVLQGTYTNFARPGSGTPFGSGVVAIDSPTSISCPGTSGTCTIEYDQSAQILNSSTSNNYGFCIYLDGSQVPPNCPSLGLLAENSTFTGYSFSQEVSGVPHGTHTVQTFILTASGGTLGYYTLTYRVYKP